VSGRCEILIEAFAAKECNEGTDHDGRDEERAPETGEDSQETVPEVSSSRRCPEPASGDEETAKNEEPGDCQGAERFSTASVDATNDVKPVAAKSMAMRECHQGRQDEPCQREAVLFGVEGIGQCLN
jgi:hypothetical protein